MGAAHALIRRAFDVVSVEDLKMLDPLLAESPEMEALFKRIVEYGPGRRLHKPCKQVLVALRRLLEEFPNFREVTTSLIGSYKISLIGGTALQLPVINLQGPPGVGKTTYVKAVAKALGQPFHDLKVSQMLERFELAGMSRGWKNATLGKIAKILLVDEAQEGQPVVLFDELCMARDTEESSVIHPLYTVFDRDSGDQFRDLFLDLPINTRYLIAFTTTNNIEKLRPALRSRLLSYNIEAPNNSEMCAVAQKLYRQLLERFNLERRFPEHLSVPVLNKLTQGSIRDMKLKLEQAITRSVGESRDNVMFQIGPEHIPGSEESKRSIGFL